MTSATSFSSSVTSTSNLASNDNAQAVVFIKGKKFRQRPLGPAPCASFEDSSDELDSPPEPSKVPGLPGITEDPASQLQTPVSPNPSTVMIHPVNITEEEAKNLKDALAGTLDPPAPPRIDISRASSSSQHEDSITSSPENDIGPQNLGFKEDGALDLKSSTEELDYIQEPGTIEESEAKRKREKMMKKQLQLKCDFGDTQSEHGELKERKDSACSVVSDVGLLYIGGRTSRLSSVGSGGSAASAMSHMSGVSHLSVSSHISRGSSRGSRSPSPHKTLLETSFCGAKPIHMVMSIEPETSPSLIARIEKPSSRPPSRLRSRSPSPHKMLLETSFCGTKQIIQSHALMDEQQKSDVQLPSNIVTKVEIVKPPQEAVAKPKTDTETAIIQPKLVVKKEKKIENLDEIKRVDEVKSEKTVSVKTNRRPVNLAKMLEQKVQQQNKPKKVISIRDIPGDEIFIPLTGPEVDLEALIRGSSPKPAEPTESTQSADVIYIPLHSPTKSDQDKLVPESSPSKMDAVENSNRSKKLHSPPKSTCTESSEKTAYVPSALKPYEVCEDGSIYIPLHTPEEEKQAKTFEEEIKRVETELRRVKAAEAERQRQLKLQQQKKQEATQQKPATLDLEQRPLSRLSQNYVPGKQDQYSGGSRSPSPGSSLSRRSSFASIFRKSDVSASPESPAPGHSRKKSGTFSNLLKDAADSIKERSRSRSKSKDRRSTGSSVSRSPSIKNNVFGNLFSRRKEEEKSNGKAYIELTKIDTQSPAPYNSASSEVDYIIIPLKDPSSAPESSDTANLEVNSETVLATIDKPPSPIEIEEKLNSPQLKRKSRHLDDQRVLTNETITLSTVMSAYRETSSSAINQLAETTSEAIVSDIIVADVQPTSASVNDEEDKPLHQSELELKDTVELVDNRKVELTIDETSAQFSAPQSNIEMQEDDLSAGGREELVAVSTDGVRTLKLPPEPSDLEEDHERKGLVVQDSFEEELPYVPTTLPLERGFGVQLKPAKERVGTEVKTYPIERPRSTTPLNPSSIEDYVTGHEKISSAPGTEVKMKICLPREEFVAKSGKSPRRLSGKGKTWFEFAEEGLQSPRDLRKSSNKSPSPPPPLPPKASSTKNASEDSSSTSWINFEELPEKRKLPKRITTVPSLRTTTDGDKRTAAPVLFSYVNPENCQCECHEHGLSSENHGEKSFKVVTGKTLPAITRNQRLPENGGKRRTSANGDIVSDCVCCAVGESENDMNKTVHTEDVDIEEEVPLLAQNSDDESLEMSAGKEGNPSWSASVKKQPVLQGTTLQVDVPNLSDSSYECSPNGNDQSLGDSAEANRPFAMDLDVQSNRSSIISQEDDQSSEDVNVH